MPSGLGGGTTYGDSYTINNFTYNDYSTNYFVEGVIWNCPNTWAGSWNCWTPCAPAWPCGGWGWGGWSCWPGWSWRGGWSLSFGFGGGGWGFGFGYAGGGWSVSVGISSGCWSGWGVCPWGWGPWGWPGWGCGWWPVTCSTWYAPWYVGVWHVPAPLVVTTPVYASVIASPLVIQEPVILTPALDWPGYAPLASSSDALASAAIGTGPTAPPIAVENPLVAMPPAGLVEQRAWDELSVGLEWQAEESFAQVLNAEPNNARARAGFGLAAALVGREATAVWALRDAISLRPDVLDSLPLMPVLRTRLTELARGLETRAMDPSGRGTIDDLFLAAALRAAVGDRAQAAYALDLASRRAVLDEAQNRFRAHLSSQLAAGL